MKKTLIVCRSYPMPEDCGSAQRTMHFVRFFESFGPVDLAYSHRGQELSLGPSRFEREIQLSRRPPGTHLGRLMRLRRIPLPISEFTEASQTLLRSAVVDRRYDHIVVRDVYNTAALFHLPLQYRKRTIIDFADVLSGRLYDDRFGSAKAAHKRAIIALNRTYLRRYEQRCLQFGAALFCSRMEMRAIVHEGTDDTAFVVPNIYSRAGLDGYQPIAGTDRGHVLLFVGALNYGPNVRGLRWFLESIFPEFQRQYPDARLMVVGKSPTPEACALCRGARAVEFYPDEPDLRRYYSRCRAVVVPLLAGGGTRIKILEAAVARRPVLSTPIGAEGLDLVDQQHLLLFRDSVQFNREYARLLDSVVYRTVTRHAEERVRSRYSAEDFSRAMTAVISRVQDPLTALSG